MKSTLKRQMRMYLLGLAMTMSLEASAEAQTEWLSVPEGEIETLLEGDDADGSDLSEESANLVAHAMLADPRESVRRALAERIDGIYGNRTDRSMEAMLKRLAGDRSRVVRAATARTLGRWMSRESSLTGLGIMHEWSLDASPRVRETLARSLAHSKQRLGVEFALERLSMDEAAEVRVWTAHTVGARYRELPKAYGMLLEFLQTDPHRKVRAAARRAAKTVA